MRPALPIVLIASLSLTGCARLADSRLNPFNWFGSSTQETAVQDPADIRPLVPEGAGQVVDSRGLVAQVAELRLNRTPDGAILRATGIASTPGSFNAQLVPVSQEAGTLTFAFRAEVSATGQQDAPSAARQVTVARVMSNAELAGIRRIRVQAANNARVVSR